MTLSIRANHIGTSDLKGHILGQFIWTHKSGSRHIRANVTLSISASHMGI